MIHALLGKKLNQLQRFLADGTRIPVTQVYVGLNPVVSLKTKEKNEYTAIQLGFGDRKNSTKSLKTAPRILREVRINNDSEIPQVGDLLKASDVFKVGDIVDVVGVSKGKGFAGVVKRHHFKGGPRTHGQSDRERAPGSIGQTTTPGRVYKGKRMAGRMGHQNVTVKNLKVVDVLEDMLSIKGLVPGAKNSILMIRKVGEDKKFVPLYKEEVEEEKENAKK